MKIKRVEDFTMDECLDYLNSGIDDEFTQQVKDRYEKIWAELKIEDTEKFNECKSKSDFQAYVDSYPLSNGKSSYIGAYLEDAQMIINKWSRRKKIQIFGIIIFVFLCVNVGSILYSSFGLNNDYKIYISKESPEYGRVSVSSMWSNELYPLLHFSPRGKNEEGWIVMATTVYNNKSPLSELYMTTIAEDVMFKRKLMCIPWLFVMVVCQIIVYKKLIKIDYLKEKSIKRSKVVTIPKMD